MSEIGVRAGISDFVGGLVKWFLILVFLMAAANILQLTQVTNFLNSIIFYIPNVVVAVVILAIVTLVGNFVYGVVRGSSRAAGMVSATFLAAISKFSSASWLCWLWPADWLSDWEERKRQPCFSGK
jgi:hypothetical protein